MLYWPFAQWIAFDKQEVPAGFCKYLGKSMVVHGIVLFGHIIQ